MKITVILCVLLFGLIEVNCQQTNEIALNSKRSSKLTIVDKLKIPAAILVWYDKYYEEHSIKPCGTANFKKFGANRVLNSNSPLMLVLPVMKQIPYMVYPNDTLIFYNPQGAFPNSMGTPSLKYKKGKNHNTELTFFESVFDSIGPCYGEMSYNLPGNVQTVVEILKYESEKLKKRNNFLNSRFSAGMIGEKFNQYAKEYFKYKFVDDVFYSIKQRNFPEKTSIDQSLHLIDSLCFFLNYDNGANFYPWYDALQSYVEIKINLNNPDSVSFDDLFKKITHNLTGKSKNFSIFYLYKLFLDQRQELIKKEIPLLKEFCTDKDYVSYITGNIVFTQKKTNSRINENILSQNGKEQTMTSVIQQLKGKIIYLDFWASWCLPCLEEMPFSKKLVNNYKGKDVAFLFLSTDSYSDRWKQSIKDNGMDGLGVHYLILDGHSNYFVKKYNITAIPRYILINKKGEVVSENAPRPSEEKTKELINKYLKE